MYDSPIILINFHIKLSNHNTIQSPTGQKTSHILSQIQFILHLLLKNFILNDDIVRRTSKIKFKSIYKSVNKELLDWSRFLQSDKIIHEINDKPCIMFNLIFNWICKASGITFDLQIPRYISEYFDNRLLI